MKFSDGDRVRVVLPGNDLDGETGTVVRVYPGGPYVVRYDDGGGVEEFDDDELRAMS